jgi:uncharacterized membrane protein HdeD (DUF308 family)
VPPPSQEAAMTMNRPELDEVQRAIEQAMRDYWKLFLIEGVILLVLGFVAVVVPNIASLAVTILLGWLFLLSGVVGLVTTFWMRHMPGFWWSLLSAVLALAAGIILLVAPKSGVLSLTLVLIVFFVMEGVASIMFALEHKRELSSRWGFMLASGIVDLVLAALIVAGLPGTAAWAIGLLAGINLMLGGAAMIGMALHARGSAAGI